MQVARRAEGQRAHVPDVGEIVLHAGCGAGQSGVLHCHAAQHQALHHRRNGLRVARGQARGRVHALFERPAHHRGYRLAVVFAHQHVRDAPLADAHVLGQHVADARLNHVHGCLAQHRQIAHDHAGRAAVHRDLESLERHRRGGAGVAVHRGRGGHDQVFPPGQVRENLAHVVDHARADADHRVARIVKLHRGQADRPLVRLDMCLLKRKPGEGIARPGKRRGNLLPRRLPGIYVGQQEGLFHAQLLQNFRQAQDGVFLNIDLFDTRIVLFPAGALKAILPEQLADRHFFVFHALFLRRIACFSPV